MTEKEIKALLADMTLKEKIGQLTQLDASCFNDEGPVTGAETELGIPAEDFPYAGSVLGVIGARQVEKLQKMCMEKQPHHIPVLFMADIINGYKTIFPIPLALGCSFDTEEVKKVGDIMAQESAAAGLHVTFAPMVDLVRDARWGRVMESTGEDPYLNAQMAAAMVKGIQEKQPIMKTIWGHVPNTLLHTAPLQREENTIPWSYPSGLYETITCRLIRRLLTQEALWL